MFRVRVWRKAWSRRDDDKAVELVSLQSANAGRPNAKTVLADAE